MIINGDGGFLFAFGLILGLAKTLIWAPTFIWAVWYLRPVLLTALQIEG